MKQALKYQRPAIWWALFIFILCNISFGTVGKSHLFFLGFDKVTHCGLFFVLTAFMGAGIIRKYGMRHFTLGVAIITFAVAVIYGGIIELLQLYVFTWRNGEWDDLFCDAVGAGMAILGILVALYAAVNEKD